MVRAGNAVPISRLSARPTAADRTTVMR